MHFKLVAVMDTKREVVMEVTVAEESVVAEVINSQKVRKISADSVRKLTGTIEVNKLNKLEHRMMVKMAKLLKPRVAHHKRHT